MGFNIHKHILSYICTLLHNTTLMVTLSPTCNCPRQKTLLAEIQQKIIIFYGLKDGDTLNVSIDSNIVQLINKILCSGRLLRQTYNSPNDGTLVTYLRKESTIKNLRRNFHSGVRHFSLFIYFFVWDYHYLKDIFHDFN